MLLALVMVMLLPVLALGAARASTRGALDSAQMQHVAEARAVARSLMPTLLGWAATHESSPPDTRVYSTEPTLVLDVVYDDGARRIRVDAIDLSGRLHTDFLANDLADALPAALRGPPASELLDNDRAGADADASRRPPLDALVRDARVFPSAQRETHWAQRWLTTSGRGALNVRSAPRELLAAAIIDGDPSVRRDVEEARSIDNELAQRIINAGRDQKGTAAPVPLTDRSEAWGFLITATSGELTSRWWLIAEPSPRTSSGRAWTAIEFRRVLE